MHYPAKQYVDLWPEILVTEERNIGTLPALFISTLLYVADAASIKIEGKYRGTTVNKTVTVGIKKFSTIFRQSADIDR